MLNAIIMASGFGRRIGKNKLLLSFNKKTLIEHTIDKIIECNFSNIILVAWHSDILKIGRDKNILTIYNDNAENGQSESIKLGILNSPSCHGYMFFTGDQPLLDVDTINLLIGKFENNRESIIVPVYKEKRGNPVIFPAKYAKELLNLTGDVGGRDIINKHRSSALFIEINNEYVLWDIDTEDDYKKLVKLQKGC